MFSKFDHITGAISVRLKRYFLKSTGKPDLSYITQKLFVGGHCSIHTLWKSNIKAIVDLRMEAEDDRRDLEKYDIEYLHLSIQDRSIPSTTDVNQAIDWIRTKLEKDQNVFIHCNLGRGRAPLIACAYMIYNGMSNEEAIKLVKAKRKVTYFNKRQLSWLAELSLQNNL